jgi:uncharacterized membrane protein YeiH
MWEMLETAGTVLFVLDAVGLAVFVVLYGLRSDWRATEAGRAMMRFVAVLLAIMTAAIVLRFAGDALLVEPARLLLRVLLFGALLAGIVHLNVVLLRVQRREHAGRGDGG